MADFLDPEYQTILRRIATDDTYFARHCLKIVDKAGQLIPLEFNRAQLYIHECLEKQRRETGMVRAVIVKGRQQGCLAPDTKVLTSELRWEQIKDLQVGQRVVACDENTTGKGKGQHRKMQTAVVEKVWWTRKLAYRLIFDDSRSVVCSGDHKWLIRKTYKDPRWRTVNGSTPDKRDAIKVGDLLRAVTEPWGEPTFDDAWFGGMIDGEGSFNHQKRIGGVDLSVSQVDGLVLSRMKAHCLSRRYGGCVISDDGPRRSKFGRRPVHAISIGGMSALFRLFGLSRPTRFTGPEWWVGRKLPQDCWRRVVAVEALGEQDLVDIQTSTGTYIAEGLVSHNCTTFIQARFFHRTMFSGNLSAFVLAHQDASTKKIFSMAQKFRQNLPPDLKFPLVKDTERGFAYENGSGYDVGTAGSAQVGRGTTVHLFHGSEVGFYENADQLSTGLLQAVADAPGTEMIFESTANGPGNFFYNLVMQAKGGKNSFQLIFIPWFWEDGYRSFPGLQEHELDEEEKKYWAAHKADGLTLEHLAWRRKKIADFGGPEQKWKMTQEYPFTVEEAFVKAEGRFFDLGAVYAAKARTADASPRSALVIGVDQGRTGDETVIARRQGNKVFPLEIIPGDDGDQRDMRLAGHLAKIIDKEQPDMVFIDTTNEHGALDRLHELGYKKVVRGIHFGETALDKTRHRNKRVEMHVEFRAWTANPDSVIPDDQKLISEIGAIPKEKESSNNVMYLVSKDDIKSDLGWSPNRLDAVILTFAYPVKRKNPDVEAEQERRRAEQKSSSAPRYQSRLNSLRR